MRIYAADRRIGDVDNLLGAVMDAYIPLGGRQGNKKAKLHVFPNDRQVRLAVVEKTFVESPDEEGVWIRVLPYSTSLSEWLFSEVCRHGEETETPVGV